MPTTQPHPWISKSGRPYTARVRSPACARCGATPDAPVHLRAALTAADPAPAGAQPFDRRIWRVPPGADGEGGQTWEAAFVDADMDRAAPAGASGDVDAAWEAMYDDFRTSMPIAHWSSLLTRHRPLIELGLLLRRVLRVAEVGVVTLHYQARPTDTEPSGEGAAG